MEKGTNKAADGSNDGVSTEVYCVQRCSPDTRYGWADGVKKETLEEAIAFRDNCNLKTRIIKRIEIVIEC